ncbi:hypothetical protein FRB90_004052, partial [Tulasnella sp. 427]
MQWALWWGPDLVLLYNDAYAIMSGSKHPALFAQYGKVAWGELWEAIGPLADQVIRERKSVAREDDLLFFGRLTEKMLPEETYHNWAWIPCIVEDGSVGGFFNTTFESTSKILYERRIQILRTLGDKTALARSRTEFAEAMRSVLTDDAHKDVPFAAFYFNTVDTPPKTGREEESTRQARARIRVTSTLAFKIGIPDGHPAIPDREVHLLDPITLRPSLPSLYKRSGASPGSTIDARSLPDDTTIVAYAAGESDPALDGMSSRETFQVDDTAWPFFDVFSAKKPLHITSLPSTIGPGFGVRKNGWNDPPREAIVMPIAAEGDDVPIAVMILGVNTRRPYDKGREAELKKAEQLAQLDAAKTSFFSSASHELRTPLTLIAGPVQEALRLTTEPRVKQQLSMTTRNIERLQKLVDSLMDFTRVEGGRMYGRFKATGLADYTTDLAELFRNPIEKNKIELVKLHGGYITLESTPEDKDDPEAPHGSTFTVHIPLGYEHLPPANVDEELAGIRAAPRAYGRAMIEEAKGWNKVRALSDDKDRSESGGSDSNANSNTDSSRSGDLAGMFRFSPDDAILIVDDNSDVRRFLRSIFQSHCNILEADNAVKGLSIIEEQSPNLVLSDVMMPGMDGIQFVGAIRERPRISWTPIILLTARAGEEARVEGLTSGADDYISKPFKTQELIARVHLHLNLGKRKRELLNLFEERTKEIKIVSDLSPVGIFRTDPQGEITYTNRRWHEITDYPSNQSLTNWLWNVHPEFQKEVLELTTRVLRTGEGGSLEIRWQNERWTKLQVESISNGLIGTVTDVSDRHLYEAARIAQAQEREAIAQMRAADAERQRAEADERRRAQELLVDVTSHELRQPVSAILNCSQLVRTNLGNLAEALRKSRTAAPFVPSDTLLKQIEDDLDALDSIYQCGLSQERIANDVLSLSRMQLDTLSIHTIDFQLVPELQRIVSIFANELK